MAKLPQASDQTLLRKVVGCDAPTMARIPAMDVVFVHGLGGDHVSTWRAGERNDSWLEWLAEDLPSVAVWALGYPSGATKWTAAGEGMALPDRAGNLIGTMLYYGIGSRPTVFVCHSLGGLVVKQVLRHSAEMAVPEWHPIAASTLGVAFLATPHSGSTLATLGRAIRLSRVTRTTLALTAHCPHLKELADWYRQNVGALDIETIAYAESRRVRRGLRLVTVVNPSSANPGIKGCITTSVDADHIEICKPPSRSSDTYRGIETFIRRQLSRVALSEPPDINGAGTVMLPPDLVLKIREAEAWGELRLLDPFAVRELKMGILKRHYGVSHDE